MGYRRPLAAALCLSACVHAPPPRDPGPAAPIVEFVTRQEILTPLPLRVRLPARYGAERVLVFFHTWGSEDWGTLELARRGQTWAGEVSCREVSDVTGDTRYFFVAVDARGEVVADSGSPEWPHVATIVGALPEGPRALPGAPPPRRCHDVSVCPPDFPGCPAYAFRRPACSSHAACGPGRMCAWDGYCAPEHGFGAEPRGPEELLQTAIRRALGGRALASLSARLTR